MVKLIGALVASDPAGADSLLMRVYFNVPMYTGFGKRSTAFSYMPPRYHVVELGALLLVDYSGR